MNKKLSPSDKKKTLFLVSFIMFINSLSYGIIIPLLYPYSQKFGISPFGLSLLFSIFSLFQFIATPIIGRLSDKYGRKPLLFLSILGTSASMAVFALAQTVTMLFIARIMDGITGGNIAVAQATIADTRKGSSRNRAFGIMWAVFGLGFGLGPVIGGLLSTIHLAFPFWFGSFLAFINSILIIFILKETHQPQQSVQISVSDFKLNRLLKSLTEPIIGKMFIASFLIASGLQTFIIGFQTYAVDILQLTPTHIGIVFSGFGLVSFAVRSIGMDTIVSFLGSESKVISTASLIGACLLIPFGFFSSFAIAGTIAVLFMASRAPLQALIPSFISKNSPTSYRGESLGIEQSFNSLGKIVGPMIAGIVASFWIPGVFIIAGLLYLLSFQIIKLGGSFVHTDL